MVLHQRQRQVGTFLLLNCFSKYITKIYNLHANAKSAYLIIYPYACTTYLGILMFTWQFSFVQENYLHNRIFVTALDSNEDYVLLSIL